MEGGSCSTIGKLVVSSSVSMSVHIKQIQIPPCKPCPPRWTWHNARLFLYDPIDGIDICLWSPQGKWTYFVHRISIKTLSTPCTVLCCDEKLSEAWREGSSKSKYRTSEKPPKVQSFETLRIMKPQRNKTLQRRVQWFLGECLKKWGNFKPFS